MEENDEDQRLPHHRNPKEFVSPKHLSGLPCFSVTFNFTPLKISE